MQSDFTVHICYKFFRMLGIASSCDFFHKIYSWQFDFLAFKKSCAVFYSQFLRRSISFTAADVVFLQDFLTDLLFDQ